MPGLQDESLLYVYITVYIAKPAWMASHRFTRHRMAQLSFPPVSLENLFVC